MKATFLKISLDSGNLYFAKAQTFYKMIRILTNMMIETEENVANVAKHLPFDSIKTKLLEEW